MLGPDYMSRAGPVSREDVKILKPTHLLVSECARVTQAPLSVMPYKDMPYYIRLRR